MGRKGKGGGSVDAVSEPRIRKTIQREPGRVRFVFVPLPLLERENKA